MGVLSCLDVKTDTSITQVRLENGEFLKKVLGGCCFNIVTFLERMEEVLRLVCDGLTGLFCNYIQIYHVQVLSF